MQSMNSGSGRWSHYSAFVLVLAVPAVVIAEPGVSHAHVPYLMVLAVGVSAVLAWITVKLIARGGRLQTLWRRWGLAVLLFAVYLLLVAPFVVGLGNIAITGRTM